MISMWKCQYCGSDVRYETEFRYWVDLLSLNECRRAFKGKHEPQQEAEFYVNSNNYEVVYETDNYLVIRNGEMRYYKPTTEEVFRYTDVFLRAGYVHDIAFEIAIERGELQRVNNPWFEVVDKKNLNDEIVFDYLDDAINEALRLNRKGGVSSIGEIMDDLFDKLATRSNH